MADASKAGPRQNFPTALQAIHFVVGRWLVIEIHKFAKNSVAVIKPVGSQPDMGLSPTADINNFVRRMPFVEGAPRSKKPDALDVLRDKILQSVEWRNDLNDVALGDPQPGYTKESRNLLFINLSLLQKNQKPNQKRVTFDLKLEGIPANNLSSGGKWGYYAWSTEQVPGLGDNAGDPPPTSDDVFAIHEFHVFWSGDPYFQIWISWVNAVFQLGLENRIMERWIHDLPARGFPTPSPQQTDGYGWASEAEQLATINALNAYKDWEFATFGGTSTDYGIRYYPIKYFFPDAPDVHVTRSVEYKIKAGYYAGRLNFPYDLESNPGFPKASEDTKADDKDQRYAEYSMTKTQPSTDSVIRVVLDSKNHVTIAQES